MKNADKAFLTVVIPIYNAEKYIAQCMDSLIAVRREEMEIIVVDDGSTDGGPGIVSGYCRIHPEVKLLRQGNSGPSAARNLGMAHASGRYVTFVDGDDYVDPETLGRHMELMRGREFDIWASDFYRVADNGRVLDSVFQIEKTEFPIEDAAYLEQFLRAGDCVWNVWRYVFSREFIERNGLVFREGYNIAEDLEFMVRALTACRRPVFFHEPYYRYRVNYGASLTRVYTAERVRQFTEMILLARTHLGMQQTDMLIRKKLAREYILNLSLYAECPRDERNSAYERLRSASELSEDAAGVYKAAATAVKVTGIRASAWLLLGMKRVKRRVRRHRQLYGKAAGVGGDPGI